MNFFQTVNNSDTLGQTATPAAASPTRVGVTQRIAGIKNVNFDGPIRWRRDGLAPIPAGKRQQNEQTR